MFAKLSVEKVSPDDCHAIEKAKASLDVCQSECGENKLDRIPKDLEREKAKF